MDRTEFDTRSGIEMRLSGDRAKAYDAVYELVRERRLANAAGLGPLTPFCVLGRFYLDERGGAHPLATGIFPKIVRDSMPPVMTRAQYDTLCEAFDSDGHHGGADQGSGGRLRPPHVVCARCGQGWTVDDCADYVCPNGELEQLPLAEHVGKTMLQVQAFLDAKTDGIYDPTADDGDDRVIAEGDEMFVHVARFYHPACHAEIVKIENARLSEVKREWARQTLEMAGFTNVRIDQAPMPRSLAPAFLGEGTEGEVSDEQLRQLSDEIPYFRVTSDVGSFGLCESPMTFLIDLEGTGLTVPDIAPAAAPFVAAMGIAHPICPLDDEAILLRLWQALAKKKR